MYLYAVDVIHDKLRCNEERIFSTSSELDPRQFLQFNFLKVSPVNGNRKIQKTSDKLHNWRSKSFTYVESDIDLGKNLDYHPIS